MLYTLFGTPSAYSQWLLHLLRQIVETAHGPARILSCVYFSQLREAWAHRAGEPLIIFSDIPEQKLSALMLQARAPIVVAYDDPLLALAFNMQARQIDLRQGIRFLAQSYATLENIYLASNSLVVSPRNKSMRLADFIHHVLSAYNLTLGEEQMQAVLTRMIGPGSLDETAKDNLARHIPPVATTFDKAEQALARTALMPYAMAMGRRPINNVVCPVELLHDWDHPGHYLSPAPIDLTGPARILTAGHSLHLPVGRWRARVEIEVEENLSGNVLSTDVLLGDLSVGGVTGPLPAQGAFTFEIDFDVSDAFPPVQLRMVLQQGAIEGYLALRHLEYERL